MGYAFSRGAAAASDGLARLLAQRDVEEKRRLMEEEMRSQEASRLQELELRARGQKSDDKYREESSRREAQKLEAERVKQHQKESFLRTQLERGDLDPRLKMAYEAEMAGASIPAEMYRDREAEEAASAKEFTRRRQLMMDEYKIRQEMERQSKREDRDRAVPPSLMSRLVTRAQQIADSLYPPAARGNKALSTEQRATVEERLRAELVNDLGSIQQQYPGADLDQVWRQMSPFLGTYNKQSDNGLAGIMSTLMGAGGGSVRDPEEK